MTHHSPILHAIHLVLILVFGILLLLGWQASQIRTSYPILGSTLYAFLRYRQTLPTAPFEISGVPLVRPFASRTSFGNAMLHAAYLKGALKRRFDDLASWMDVVDCNVFEPRYESILHPTDQERSAHPVSIAITLKDSENVIPSQTLALIEAAVLLLPGHEVYVSVYSNGSEDHTAAMLGELTAALSALGVDGLWIVASTLRSDLEKVDRINLLAEVRNAVLRPLIPYAGNGTLVFINDIVFCASDVLELLLQREIQGADVAVGNDWDQMSHSRNGTEVVETKVYDLWVHRGINGEMVYPHHPHPQDFAQWLLSPPENVSWAQQAYATQELAVYQRCLSSLPFPVYAAWGGMAAFNASLFTSEHLRFRSTTASGWSGGSSTGALGKWGELVASTDYMAEDCPGASECELVMRDVWNLRDGKAKIVMAPQVNTAYTVQDWRLVGKFVPFVDRRSEVINETGIELIGWTGVKAPARVVCLPSRTETGESTGRVGIWQQSGSLLDPLSRLHG